MLYANSDINAMQVCLLPFNFNTQYSTLIMFYTKKNILNGALIYAVGDTIAALIIHEFSWLRLLGMALIGGTVYAFEIPNFYAWLEKRTEFYADTKKWIAKTLWATVYFNPLWIARHMLFIAVLNLQFSSISWSILTVALASFLWSLPVTFLGNYLIQNKFSLKNRFIASSVFSGLMAIYYALSSKIGF